MRVCSEPRRYNGCIQATANVLRYIDGSTKTIWQFDSNEENELRIDFGDGTSGSRLTYTSDPNDILKELL